MLLCKYSLNARSKSNFESKLSDSSESTHYLRTLREIERWKKLYHYHQRT